LSARPRRIEFEQQAKAPEEEFLDTANGMVLDLGQQLCRDRASRRDRRISGWFSSPISRIAGPLAWPTFKYATLCNTMQERQFRVSKRLARHKKVRYLRVGRGSTTAPYNL